MANLEQSEIDALLASIQSGDEKKAASVMEPGEARRKADAYSFSRAGQISNEQMKAISIVNDLFARNLSHNLGAWLRSNFHVSLVSGEQMIYQEFLERLPELAYVCAAQLEPLDVLGVIQLDLSLAPPIVDLLLGGTGRSEQPRELTDIEEEILASVMEIIVRELNIAWQPVGLRFDHGKREREAQIARVMAPAEKTLCVSFEIRMPAVQGTLNLCLPSVVLNTILRRLTSERIRPRRRTSEAKARMAELVSGTEFGASLQFPVMRLNARDISGLTPGKIIRLPLSSQSVGELRIAGLPVFTAQPVRSGEHRGAQIVARSEDPTRSLVM